MTGASLPDEGDVRVFGRSTAAVSDGDEWLASLDRFGIVSERAVLLEGATLMQNLALPFALDIDPVRPEHGRARSRPLPMNAGSAATWLISARGRRPGRRSRPRASCASHRARPETAADGASDRGAERPRPIGTRSDRSSRASATRAR